MQGAAQQQAAALQQQQALRKLQQQQAHAAVPPQLPRQQKAGSAPSRGPVTHTGTQQVRPQAGSQPTLAHHAAMHKAAPPKWDLQDPLLRRLVNSLETAEIKKVHHDELSRQDFLKIFQLVEKGKTLSKKDFADLETILAFGSRLGTLGYVENLAGKVVNGNSANADYLGHALGNLHPGSTRTQLEDLVGKWFLGTDHPQASGSYAYASGQLFGKKGPSLQDVRQGELGDCWLMASLGELALRAPKDLRNMFIYNGDQTWTVRFYVNGQPTYVTVDRYLPTNGAGQYIYANMGQAVNNPKQALWVALAEKAYAQLNESGGLGRSAGTSYASLGGGNMIYPIDQVSNKWDDHFGSLNFKAMVQSWNKGEVVCLASGSGRGPIVGDHAYALVGYNAKKGTFTVFNPWGINNGHDSGLITLTWKQLAADFAWWDGTPK